MKEEINRQISSFIGEFGKAEGGVMIMNEWNNNKGIIKTNTRYLDKVKSALMLDTKIPIRSIKVSGMINRAKAVLR